MLYEIALENFKPFAERQVAPLSKITLIYGPNSAGKSSLIQALMLLRQTLDGSATQKRNLIPRGEYVDLGSFKSLLHRHDTDRLFQVRLAFDRPQGRRVALRSLPGDERRRVSLAYKAVASPGSRKKDSSELESITYELDEGARLASTLRCVRNAPRSQEPASEAPARRAEVAGRRVFQWAGDEDVRSYAEYVVNLEKRRSQARGARADGARSVTGEHPLPEAGALIESLREADIVGDGFLPGRLLPPLRETPGPPRRGEAFQFGRFFEGPLTFLAAEFEAVLGSLAYLGPLRSHPARHYLVAGGEKSTVGVRGENTPQLIYGRTNEITREINRWFERFEIPYKMRVTAIGDELIGEILVMQLVDRRSKVDVAPSDVGFGIGQLLPIIVQGLASEGRILCVEQPEIHLHPRLQAHVADLFIETIRPRAETYRGYDRGSVTNQWIVETHSESLILRLQRRIREKTLSCEDVSVLYVDPGDQGSRILHLRLDEAGEFRDPWPDGFFEERYAEVFGE